MNWIPVEMPPPKSGEYMVSNSRTGEVRMAKWRPMTKLWMFTHWQQRFEVTHWGELPEPPK